MKPIDGDQQLGEMPMYRIRIAVVMTCMLVSAGGPVTAQEDPAEPRGGQGKSPPAGFDVTFPDDWSIEKVGPESHPALFAGGEDIQPDVVLLRAYPPDRPEECQVVDMTAAWHALTSIGVERVETLNFVATDIRHGPTKASSWSIGTNANWSAYLEGSDEAGRIFVVYNFMGRDAWPGLEDTWLVLDCWSDGTLHEDWQAIAGTFTFETPEEVLASGGPVVVGGRLESPAGGYALELPEGWIGADLLHPEVISRLESMGSATDWFADQLAGSLGETFADRAADGGPLSMWAWRPESGPFWTESCEVVTQESAWESVGELVALHKKSYESDPELRPNHDWARIELPAGVVARHDFKWSSQIVGSEFIFLRGDQQIVLRCQDTDVGADEDVVTMRDRWLSIAETFRFLTEEPTQRQKKAPKRLG